MSKLSRKLYLENLDIIHTKLTIMAIDFVWKYFWREAEWWFIWDNPGEIPMVVYVNDLFFNIDTMYTALYYDVKYDDLMEWYDLNSQPGTDYKVNFHSFCMWKWYTKNKIKKY